MFHDAAPPFTCVRLQGSCVSWQWYRRTLCWSVTFGHTPSVLPMWLQWTWPSHLCALLPILPFTHLWNLVSMGTWLAARKEVWLQGSPRAAGPDGEPESRLVRMMNVAFKTTRVSQVMFTWGGEHCTFQLTPRGIDYQTPPHDQVTHWLAATAEKRIRKSCSKACTTNFTVHKNNTYKKRIQPQMV